MKKEIFPGLLAVVLVMVLLCAGCAAEVSREPIDRRYIAAHSEMETNYVHRFDMWKGEMVMVPEIRTVQHPEKFQILYRITYDNGTTADQWVDVSRDEYTAFGG